MEMHADNIQVNVCSGRLVYVSYAIVTLCRARPRLLHVFGRSQGLVENYFGYVRLQDARSASRVPSQHLSFNHWQHREILSPLWAFWSVVFVVGWSHVSARVNQSSKARCKQNLCHSWWCAQKTNWRCGLFGQSALEMLDWRAGARAGPMFFAGHCPETVPVLSHGAPTSLLQHPSVNPSSHEPCRQ